MIKEFYRFTFNKSKYTTSCILLNKPHFKPKIQKDDAEKTIELACKTKDYRKLTKIILFRDHRLQFTNMQFSSILDFLSEHSYDLLFRFLTLIDYNTLDLLNTTKIIFILTKRHIDINKDISSPTLSEKPSFKSLEVYEYFINSKLIDEKINPDINILLALSIFNVHRFYEPQLIYYLITALTINNNKYIGYCNILISLYNENSIDLQYNIFIRTAYSRYFILRDNISMDKFYNKIAKADIEEKRYVIGFYIDAFITFNNFEFAFEIFDKSIDSSNKEIYLSDISILLCRRFLLSLLKQGKIYEAMILYNNESFYRYTFEIKTKNEFHITDIIHILSLVDNGKYIDISLKLAQQFKGCMNQEIFDLFTTYFISKRKDLNDLVSVIISGIDNSAIVYHYLDNVGYEQLFYTVQIWKENNIDPSIISHSLYIILSLPLDINYHSEVIHFIINKKLSPNKLLFKKWNQIHSEIRNSEKLKEFGFNYFSFYILHSIRFELIDHYVIHDVVHLKEYEKFYIYTMLSNYYFELYVKNKILKSEYTTIQKSFVIKQNGKDIIYNFGLDFLYNQNWFMCYSRLIYAFKNNVYPGIGSLKYIVRLLIENKRYLEVSKIYFMFCNEENVRVLGFKAIGVGLYSDYVLAFSVLNMKTIAFILLEKMSSNLCFVQSDSAIFFLAMYKEDRTKMYMMSQFLLKEMKYVKIPISDLLLDVIIDNLVDLKCLESSITMINLLGSIKIQLNETVYLKIIKIANNFKSSVLIDLIFSIRKKFKDIDIYNELIRFSIITKSQSRFDYYSNLIIHRVIKFNELTYMLLFAGYTQLDKYKLEKALNLLLKLEKTNLLSLDHFILLIRNITLKHDDKETGNKLYDRMRRAGFKSIKNVELLKEFSID